MPDKIYETRRKNLLIATQERGAKERIAEQAGVTSSYISQLASGHRPIGERAARKIERSIGKPSGWMDQESLDDLRSEVRTLVDEVARMNDADVQRVVDILRAYLGK